MLTKISALLLMTSVLHSTSHAGTTTVSVPSDFPAFTVPGQETAMSSLRHLYWLHYPRSGPKATMWDEWLPNPSLWPAVETENLGSQMRTEWRRALSNRLIDPEGYVACHQHASISHQTGWPFPAWHQGGKTYGWHFSFKGTPPPPWRGDHLSTQEGWQLHGAEDGGIDENGWTVVLNSPAASLTLPPRFLDAEESPFLQLRWKAEGLASDARPWVEWTTSETADFSTERRVYFDPPAAGDDFTYTMIPVGRHPDWRGPVTRLRVGFGNKAPGVRVTVQALFTQYDTRHNINNTVFLTGCTTYFNWTRDLAFLRENIQRMRTALHYALDEFQVRETKVVTTPWTGHDGQSGLRWFTDGTTTPVGGQGIGNNYWDLLPFGYKDTYATIRLFHALRAMADLERSIREHPEWNLPKGFLAFDPDDLDQLAREVKETGNRLFWNEQTGRFAAGVDVKGKKADYGFTFVNLDAVHYDFATAEHADSIMSWICGERTVADDTSQTSDIYHWRFGPRATTRRNVEYYMWCWSAPDSIPWGGQVQDGGAVLGFSFFDLSSRIKTRGADSAWQRLQEIASWFDEVQAAGGYRAYYNGNREGTLQGGGTAGGLGLDEEFFESALLPHIMLDGFAGFTPHPDGFTLAPKLPAQWPELTIDRIHFQDVVLSIKAGRDAIEVRGEGSDSEPCYVRLPEGEWKAEWLPMDGAVTSATPPKRRASDGAFEIHWLGTTGVRFVRAMEENAAPAPPVETGG